eukprot:gene18455-biopygen12958
MFSTRRVFLKRLVRAGGGTVAQAWRGHSAGMSCSPRGGCGRIGDCGREVQLTREGEPEGTGGWRERTTGPC